MTEHILNGYRVIDLTHVLAGPSATRLMVEMGAEVIKVEFPPLGDIARVLPVLKNGRSAYYVQQNRGKLSISLDIKSAEGKQILTELIRSADVLIENFAPGVIGRLGFSWEKVKNINPSIVMCSMSAFGQEGELSALPGFDYIAQAYSGIMGMIGEKDGPPSFPMAGIGDVMTGAHAFAAVGYALLHREKTEEGQYIDVSLLDCYAHCHELNIEVYSLSDPKEVPTRSGHHHFAVCPLGLFKGREKYICIIALQMQWASLCRVIGREDLIEDERYCDNDRRVKASEEVIGFIQDWIDKQTDDGAVISALQKERVPCAPVLDIAEVVNHPHLLERGTIRTVDDPKLGDVLMPGMPLRFSSFKHNQNLNAAFLGEHNHFVLNDILGYTDERIKQLEESKVIFSDSTT